MNRKSILMIGTTTVWLAVSSGLAISAQDSGQNKYTVKVPGVVHVKLVCLRRWSRYSAFTCSTTASVSRPYR